MPFAATWMQLEIIVLSEVSQEGNDKYHMISRVCRISIRHNCSYHKTETDSQTQRTDLWLPRGKLAGEETDWEFGIRPILVICLARAQVTFAIFVFFLTGSLFCCQKTASMVVLYKVLF